MATAFSAIEDSRSVAKAMADFHAKFADGSSQLRGLGANTYWHPRLAMWGHFNRTKNDRGAYRFWNPFGMAEVGLRQNMIVEINPPASGRDLTRQGLLARSKDGNRWLLHRGRMSIPSAHISEAQFDAAATSKRIQVRFADGEVVGCHPVTDIDSDAMKLQDRLAAYVRMCRRIRLHYHLGKRVAEQEAAIEAAESNPEARGSYLVGPQEARTVFRGHGEVWHALVDALDQIGKPHTNSRVGKWGPDLRTVDAKPTLFEIKVTNSASNLQCAVGQLLLYERLLKVPHKKVLVLQDHLTGEIAAAVKTLKMDVLLYSKKAGRVRFDKADVLRVCRAS